MLPASADSTRVRHGGRHRCVRRRGSQGEMKVAAIGNWFGITRRSGDARGSRNRTERVHVVASLPPTRGGAKRVSPLTYVRAGLPVVFTVHRRPGHAGSYAQAERRTPRSLRAGVPNRLLTDSRSGTADSHAEQGPRRLQRSRVPGRTCEVHRVRVGSGRHDPAVRPVGLNSKASSVGRAGVCRASLGLRTAGAAARFCHPRPSSCRGTRRCESTPDSLSHRLGRRSPHACFSS